jgi:hypothetical protein
VSPGGGEQVQLHHPASLSSESGESLRHVGCYSAKGRWGSRKACGDAESVRGRSPRPPLLTIVDDNWILFVKRQMAKP